LTQRAKRYLLLDLLEFDEMANLAWGVERVVEGLSGRAMDRRQVYLERQGRDEAPAPAGFDLTSVQHTGGR
jgi:hypothetical protein